MCSSEHINELATALSKAQAEIKNANFNATNSHFQNKYADLAEIRDCVIPKMAEHGLSIAQLVGVSERGTVLITRLMHSSGQWLDSVYPLAADAGNPQKMGSALTYARRYCLAAIAGIAAEEDDDGNAAADGKQNSKPSQPAAPPTEALEARDMLVAQIKKAATADAVKTLASEPGFSASFKKLDNEWPELSRTVDRAGADRVAYLSKAEAGTAPAPVNGNGNGTADNPLGAG